MHHTDPHVRRAVRRQTTPPPTPPPQPRRPVNWVGGDHSRRIKPDSLLADAQRREQDRPGRAAGPDRPVHHRSGCSVRTTDTTVAQGKRPAVVKPRLAAFGHARKLQQPHTTHYLAAVRGVVQVAVVGGASVADQPVVAGDAHRVAVGIEGKGTSTTLENTASLGVSESGPTNSAVLPLRVLLATGAGRWVSTRLPGAALYCSSVVTWRNTPSVIGALPSPQPGLHGGHTPAGPPARCPAGASPAPRTAQSRARRQTPPAPHCAPGCATTQRWCQGPGSHRPSDRQAASSRQPGAPATGCTREW